MADVFVSYARDDRSLVEVLVQQLEARGLEVWWDAHIDGADDFEEVIKHEIDNASAVIVVWTSKSVASLYVRDEARYAARQNKLVAVKSLDLDAGEIPFGFQSQHADLISQFENIISGLRKKGIQTPIQSHATPQPSNLTRGGTQDEHELRKDSRQIYPKQRFEWSGLHQLRSAFSSAVVAFCVGMSFIRPLSFVPTAYGKWMAGGSLLSTAILTYVSFLLLPFLVRSTQPWTQAVGAPYLAFLIVVVFLDFILSRQLKMFVREKLIVAAWMMAPFVFASRSVLLDVVAFAIVTFAFGELTNWLWMLFIVMIGPFIAIQYIIDELESR